MLRYWPALLALLVPPLAGRAQMPAATFALLVNLPAMGSPNSISMAMADVNGDGKLAALPVNGGPSTPRVLPNTMVFAAPATVTTFIPTDITSTSATLGGNITADGDSPVTERGVVYSTTTTTPTTADSKVVSGTGAGGFSRTVTGLTADAQYTVRAYAINSAGTSYGNAQSFTANPTVTAAPFVITPANGSILNTPRPNYVGQAPRGSIVTVYLNNKVIGTVTSGGSGNFALTQPTDPNQPAGLSDGTYTVRATAQASGQTMSVSSNTNTFIVDLVRPTVVISSPITSPAMTSPIPITVTFSEPVTGFELSDLDVSNSTLSDLSGSDAVYTFNVTPTSPGELRLLEAIRIGEERHPKRQ